MRSEKDKCRWEDDYKKCNYWMPDSKMTCDCLDNQSIENCKEYESLESKEGNQ